MPTSPSWCTPKPQTTPLPCSQALCSICLPRGLPISTRKSSSPSSMPCRARSASNGLTGRSAAVHSPHEQSCSVFISSPRRLAGERQGCLGVLPPDGGDQVTLVDAVLLLGGGRERRRQGGVADPAAGHRVHPGEHVQVHVGGDALG